MGNISMAYYMQHHQEGHGQNLRNTDAPNNMLQYYKMFINAITISHKIS